MPRKSPKRSTRKSSIASPQTLGVWSRGTSRLIEQGRLMWLLGEGLSAILAAQHSGWAPDEETLAADLFGWTEKVLARGPWGLGLGQAKPHPSTQLVAKARTKATPLLALMRDDLAELKCPALWLGSSEIGGQWVSMALGVGVDGLRRVLALTAGSLREQQVAELLLSDLAARGLEPGGTLVVTEGSRTLDRALARMWGEHVPVAHCRARVRREVAGHVPDGSKERVRQELDIAWSLPVEQASALLQELELRWAVESPGAAERLARSREASLTVARLEVSSPLKERLESAGTLRMAFRKALRWAPPGPALSALTVGIPMWLQRVRRLVGWRGLELLAHTLRDRPAKPQNSAAPPA